MSLVLLQSECKRAVSTLTNLSNDELDKIMNDDEKIENILIQLDESCLKEIEREKENLLDSNSKLAELNLSREPELVEGREKLQKLTEEGEELSKRIEEKAKELRNRTGDMSLETTLALLQTSASEIEEESDQIAKKFLNNEADLDSFLDEFLIKRKLMHMRLVKAEKMSKLLTKDTGLNSIGNYINAPPVNINTNYFPGVPIPTGNVPYPTGPLNMPMPPGMNYFQNHY